MWDDVTLLSIHQFVCLLPVKFVSCRKTESPGKHVELGNLIHLVYSHFKAPCG